MPQRQAIAEFGTRSALAYLSLWAASEILPGWGTIDASRSEGGRREPALAGADEKALSLLNAGDAVAL